MPEGLDVRGAARAAGQEDNSKLDALLLPGTPDFVARAYRALEKRALREDFGPLEEDVVVLDTETTGLSFKNCELIEIAAARMSGREVVERFQTFVHPGRPIPKEITRLTSITNADVYGAPSAREAVDGLARFVGGSPVLAHNATFDRTFIEKVKGAEKVSDIWIDTLALSRIALPRLRSHRLSDMAEAFGCDAVTHRAMADVDALCGMWRILLLGLANLPAGLLSTLAEMHEEVEWPYRPILSYLAQMEGASAKDFSLKECRRDCLQGVDAGARKPKDDAADMASPPRAPSAREVRAAFAPGGPISGLFEKYEARPEQIEMAEQVAGALASSTHKAIEAGTGVGKSLAYLLPGALFARENNVCVGVATKTNALSDQLMSKDLPALDSVLPGGVSYTCLKGFEHYPCLLRLERAVRDDLPAEVAQASGRGSQTAAADALNAIAVCYSFGCQSVGGDLDALGIKWRFVPRGMLATGPAECLRTACPFYPHECLVHGARRRAAQSDVVVTNHSLLLRDIELGGRILPPIRHWVVDEAHGFEAEARRQWAREISQDVARRGFEALGSEKNGALRNAMDAALKLEGAPLAIRLVSKATAAVSRAQVACAGLFDALHGLVALLGRASGYEGEKLWINGAVRTAPEWESFAEEARATGRSLDEAGRALKAAAACIGDENPQAGAELLEAAAFLGGMGETLSLVLSGEDETYVYFAELFRHKKDVVRERLVAEKVDVGASLAEKWLPEMRSVIFTSATMAVGSNFNHFNHSVGLDLLEKGEHAEIRLNSSFDFERNMSVVVVSDMPEPGSPRYAERLEQLLFDVHVGMGGSVLTLFTNRREMERAFAALEPRLGAEGLTLLCQERRSSPQALRQKFLAEKNSSLMALKSFWEGFDASGDTLRCVVVAKLPFASPKDPLVQQRAYLDERSWWKYSLPEAVLEVKQAAGRLIRSAGDTGVVVIADSRVATKRYGRQFVLSMPNPSATRLEAENVRRYLEMWTRSRP